MKNYSRWIVFLLISGLIASGWSHHHHHNHHQQQHRRHDERSNGFEFDVGDDKRDNSFASVTEKTKRSLKIDDSNKGSVPFSARRLEKMLEKAILKIITGDLSTADMLLLKSLNYSLEEVLAIREYELGKKKEEERRREEEKVRLENRKIKEKHRTFNSMENNSHSARSSSSSSSNLDAEDAVDEGGKKKEKYPEKRTYDEDFDFDAYNRQAVLDYENLASKMEVQQSWSDPVGLDYEDAVKEWKEKNVKDGTSKEDKSSVENVHKNFDKAMEPHVIFKIRYDDSDFDSGSDERLRIANKHHAATKNSKHRVTSNAKQQMGSKNTANSFHSSSTSSSFSAASMHSPLPLVIDRSNSDLKSSKADQQHHERRETAAAATSTVERPEIRDFVAEQLEDMSNVVEDRISNVLGQNDAKDDIEILRKNKSSVNETKNNSYENGTKRGNEYEGLEWVEDDVYRVIPSIADSLSYESSIDENEPSDYEEEEEAASAAAAAIENSKNFNSTEENSTKMEFNEETENDTLEYQNDTPDPMKLLMANVNSSAENQSLSTYQQLALAHRRDQGQKAIEDIKSRVLALTGRFNLSTSANQVQRERLTMFSPTCQIPRNTDPEVWAEPYSMNMHFQLNLTSGDHVVAAKLRIYKLPQNNNASATVTGITEEEEEDEKKIRISVYYYTKSLKKHRSKKRLMDSVVTPLTPEGTHLALDVRQGLKFWRLNPRSPHGNGSNHGLVVQIEDQDGKPLKPALYVQQPSCSADNSDEKTTNYLHFSYEPVLVTFAS